MKKFVKTWVLFLAVMCLLTACNQHKPNGTSSTGQPIVLANYLGKWVIINYWATWCKPCLTEIPELEQFQRAHPNKVVVLGVNFDGITNEKINAFAKKTGATFPMTARIEVKSPDIGTIKILPTTIIISPEGKLAARLLGPQTTQALAKATGLSQTVLTQKGLS